MSEARRRPGWWEVVILAAIVVAAAALRMWNLGGLPEGLHGDEAWTGLDARRILSEGWIGPYVPSALGQPTGPLYLVAALFTFLPDDIGTIRLAMAIFGTLGVLFTLLLAREYEGPVVGGFAAVLLAVSLWHLHPSRIGMMFVACPVALLAGLWLQAVARRRDSFVLYALAGFVAGLGIYSYNAYPTATPLFALAIAYGFFSVPAGRRWRRLAQVAVFAVAAVVALLPMLRFIYEHPAHYTKHHEMVSVLATPEWTKASWRGRADILYERGFDWIYGLVWKGRFDGGDGFGIADIAVLDPITSVLAGLGLLIALFRWRRTLSGLAIAAIPLIALGALLTTGAGMYRRSIALAPFVAILAALPLALLWGRPGRTRAGRWLHGVRVALAVAVAAVVVRDDVTTYFGRFSHDPKFRWVYARDLRVLGEIAATLPPETHAYLFAERWGCGYETMRYLAPDLHCTDRSRRFGKLSRSGMLDFALPHGEPAVLFLVAEHMARIDYVERRYPDAEATVIELDGRPAFTVVRLPPDAAEHARPVPSAARPIDGGDGPVSLLAMQPSNVLYEFAPPRENLTWNAHPVRLGGRTYRRALGMHAPTEMTYPVPQRAVQFRALVGLSDQIRDCERASVVFSVRDEQGRVLAQTEVIRSGDRPRPLRADVRGAKEISLIAGDAGDGRDCDHANWANPEFVRRPAKAAE